MSGLWLSELSLSYFRSHMRAWITAGPRPLAIHGPNGAGKTNILEAVSLLSPGRGLRRAGSADLPRRPEAIGWKVTALLQHGDDRHEFETGAEAGQSRTVAIDGKPATQTALGRLARILWLTPAMDRLWADGPEGRRRFLDRMALSFEPEHGEAVLSYEKAMRERNRLLTEGGADPMWLNALESRMAEAGAMIQMNRAATVARLAAVQEGADSAFPTALLQIREAEEAATGREELADTYARTRSRDAAAGRTLSGPHRADLAAIYAARNMPAELCSTGEQKALLISLVLANARALAGEIGTAPILLLDEVAAHLDPGRRAALYAEILALGAQAWLTGTERGLFTDLEGRADFLSLTMDGGTSVLHSG